MFRRRLIDSYYIFPWNAFIICTQRVKWTWTWTRLIHRNLFLPRPSWLLLQLPVKWLNCRSTQLITNHCKRTYIKTFPINIPRQIKKRSHQPCDLHWVSRYYVHKIRSIQVHYVLGYSIKTIKQVVWNAVTEIQVLLLIISYWDRSVFFEVDR